MELNFTKMHGTGNDFILVDARSLDISDLEGTTRKLCERKFGVGADGLILVLPSETCDFRMQIINADGSEAEMCGNGIRCFAKFLYEKGITEKTELSVETLAGVIKPELLADGRVRVDMGEPRLLREEIPMNGPDGEKVINEGIEIDGETINITAVSMGNPHAVTFVSSTESHPVEEIGTVVETHKLFPKKTNVEFVEILSDEEINMRVWERGCGETLACGTGACASAVACSLNGKTKRNIRVNLIGGTLEVVWDKETNHIFMTGPATTVFEGTLNNI